jgi:hypothetical protein
MSKSSTLLMHLVADLIRAEAGVSKPIPADLLADFKRDPESVMVKYGLSEEARTILFTMDRQLIGEFVLQEILRTPAPPPQQLWSDPLPSIKAVKPNQLVSASGQTLRITADCVLSSAEVHLVSQDSFNHFIAKPRFEPSPPRLADEDLVATFDLSDAVPDDYRVLLYNTPNAPPLEAQEVVTVNPPGTTT